MQTDTAPLAHAASPLPGASGRVMLRHLLGLEDLSAEQITGILDLATQMKAVNARRIKKLPTLRGVTVLTLFVEPSTRTRMSFELAAKRLSADVMSFSAATSSLSKGETLIDTA